MQRRRNSITSTLELHLFCKKPWIFACKLTMTWTRRVWKPVEYLEGCHGTAYRGPCTWFAVPSARPSIDTFAVSMVPWLNTSILRWKPESINVVHMVSTGVPCTNARPVQMLMLGDWILCVLLLQGRETWLAEKSCSGNNSEIFYLICLYMYKYIETRISIYRHTCIYTWKWLDRNDNSTIKYAFTDSEQNACVYNYIVTLWF